MAINIGMFKLSSAYDSHYLVNGQKYQNKTLALFEANRLQLPISQIEWYFNDKEFSSLDWSIEPLQSLNDLYKLRARQIREKYDYVIVMCSGGADSTNVVYSFLENGFHIDEIIASAPLSGLRDWQDKSNDISPENTISETKLAQIPFLQEIEQKYPQVKITLNDYFEDILNYKDTDWLIRSTDFPHPTTVARYDIEKLPHLQKLAETDKKVGVVYGIDKPIINIKDGKIYNTIPDNAVNVPIEFAKFENYSIELFYYAYSLPELLIKQCHMLARWLYLPENKSAKDFAYYNGRPAPNRQWNNGYYQRAIVPCIYPNLKKKIWQAGKPQYNILANLDNWFYQHHGSLRVHDMMISNINNTLFKLHPFYFQYKEYYDERGNIKRYRHGLKGFFKTYYIGEINDFQKINC